MHSVAHVSLIGVVIVLLLAVLLVSVSVALASRMIKIVRGYRRG